MREITLQDLYDICIDNIRNIIIIALVCAILAGSYTVFMVTPMYEVSTKVILVKPAQTETDEGEVIQGEISTDDIILNQKLISTYTEILKSKKVLNKVIDLLDLDISADSIANTIKVSNVKDSEVINIKVSNADSQTGANIANELVKAFSKEVKEIYNIENVKQIDVAEINGEPINANLIKNSIIFGILGAIGIYSIYVSIYLFKTTIKSPKDVEEGLDLTILSNVPDIDIEQDEKNKLITFNDPSSVPSEAFKSLRTNILFSIEEDKKNILVSSACAGDGKSFVCSNLAITFAGLNKKVIILDLDLRKSMQHKIFDLNNINGVSNLLRKDDYTEKSVKRYIRKTKVKNLHVITAGKVPKNPSELLMNGNLTKLIEHLNTIYDYVILDSPPVSLVTDSVILSKYTDASILVCSIDKTKMSLLKEAANNFVKNDSNLIGVVVNRIPTYKSSYINKGYGIKYKYAEEEENLKNKKEKDTKNKITKAIKNVKVVKSDKIVKDESIKDTKNNENKEIIK